MKVRNPQLEAFKEIRYHPGVRFYQDGKIEFRKLETDVEQYSQPNGSLLELAKTQLYDDLAHMDICAEYSLIVLDKSVTTRGLVVSLQLLADLIAHEVHQAIQWFHNRLSPYDLTNDITISDDKVRRVMDAMQGEITREALRTKEGEYRLDQLPFERQRSLAVRRRQLFADWGIGQEEWERNSFSLWKLPEDYKIPDGL